MRRIERENTGCMRQGQDLVVAGYAGYAGTVKITRQNREELLTWFRAAYLDRILEENDTTGNIRFTGNFEQWKAFGATEWEPAGEGGIFAALWNLSGAYMTGIEFSLRKIPVKQETIEICERYDLNPYRLDSEGCVLFAAENGRTLVRALEQSGIHAAVIGTVTDGIKRIIDNGEGNAYLTRPTEDEIYKILEVRE